jgi:hypothetical protein
VLADRLLATAFREACFLAFPLAFFGALSAAFFAGLLADLFAGFFAFFFADFRATVLAFFFGPEPGFRALTTPPPADLADGAGDRRSVCASASSCPAPVL